MVGYFVWPLCRYFVVGRAMLAVPIELCAALCIDVFRTKVSAFARSAVLVDCPPAVWFAVVVAYGQPISSLSPIRLLFLTMVLPLRGGVASPIDRRRHGFFVLILYSGMLRLRKRSRAFKRSHQLMSVILIIATMPTASGDLSTWQPSAGAAQRGPAAAAPAAIDACGRSSATLCLEVHRAVEIFRGLNASMVSNLR